MFGQDGFERGGRRFVGEDKVTTLALDPGVFRRKAHAVSMKEALDLKGAH